MRVQTVQFLDAQALEESASIGFNRHDFAGTPVMKHVSVAGLQRTELENAPVGKPAEFQLGPRDARILEELRMPGADLDAWLGRQFR